MLVFKFTLIYAKADVLQFCPKSPMLDFMVNHSYFFIFVTWISLIIIGILRDIHKNVGRKNWNFGGIHGRQKKKLKPPGAKAGPSGLRFGRPHFSHFRPNFGHETPNFCQFFRISLKKKNCWNPRGFQKNRRKNRRVSKKPFYFEICNGKSDFEM